MARNFHGLELVLRSFSGARAVRVVHADGQSIEVHSHDWPSLTLPVTGGCVESFDGGSASLSGPSAAFHPAGACHADDIDALGMETVSLLFDPAWLARPDLLAAFDRSVCFSGGVVAAAARLLAALWADTSQDEDRLRDATFDFLALAATADGVPRPAWIDLVDAELTAADPRPTAMLARQLDLHPAWLARAYRQYRGEGLGDTLRRRRVEQAARLLRGTDLAPAEIALAAGFCDQSHMNRCVRALLGRTPLEVRAERHYLAKLAG